jgi:hypothetical protein
MNEDSTDNPEPDNGSAHTGKLRSETLKSSLPPLTSEPQQYKRILVIDDNPDIVFTLRVGLESDPTIQVFSFDSPVTALVEFKPNSYDLTNRCKYAFDERFSISPEFSTKGHQCQGLLYDCWRNKYECGKRGASTQEYRLFH